MDLGCCARRCDPVRLARLGMALGICECEEVVRCEEEGAAVICAPVRRAVEADRAAEDGRRLAPLSLRGAKSRLEIQPKGRCIGEPLFIGPNKVHGRGAACVRARLCLSDGLISCSTLLGFWCMSDVVCGCCPIIIVMLLVRARVLRATAAFSLSSWPYSLCDTESERGPAFGRWFSSS